MRRCHIPYFLLLLICLLTMDSQAKAYHGLASSGSPKALSTEKIIISEGIADYIALPLFESENPGVKIKMGDVSSLYSELAGKFLARDSYVDLYRLNSNLGIHQHLRAKGYFFDLSKNKIIRDFTDTLAPVFRSQVCVEDQIMGVPSFLVLEYPISINLEIAEEIGLKPEDIPDNLLDLLKFVNEWDAKYGYEFPDYFPFGAAAAGSYALAHYNPYVSLVLEMYKDTLYAQGEPLRYDTPLFYELLREVEPWTVKRTDFGNDWFEQLSQPDTCLFYSAQMFHDEIFTQVCGNGTLLKMPLTKNSPVVQAYELECAIVNPETKQPKLAVELASCYVRDCGLSCCASYAPL